MHVALAPPQVFENCPGALLQQKCLRQKLLCPLDLEGQFEAC